ncbi:MAG: fibronectin type III domain-containing protein [Candidatus Hatepunaea meridiana]|nr:fibronectin type III domain-containing protein [Candidatus Hatepunaea meridiana]
MFIKHKELYCILLMLAIAFTGCDLGTPSEVPRDNPWDEGNPNRPRTPEGLVADAVSATEIILKWRDLSGNEDGFDVYERTEEDIEFYVVTSTAASVDSVLLQNKTPNTEYVYWVRAFNNYGSSDSTNLARVATPDTPPASPSNLIARNVLETDIVLAWQDRSHNETEFQIFESISDTMDFVKIITVNQDDTTAAITDRQPLTTYYYRIRAVNNSGESDFTAIAWATPAALPPTPPTNLVADAISETEISLSWQDNSMTESGFEIYESVEDVQDFHLVKTVSLNTVKDTLTERQVNTTYFYRIRAINQYGQSEYSNIVSTTTEDNPLLPNAPTNPEAEAISPNEIILTWQDTNDNEGDIEIYESINDNQNFNLIKTVSAIVTSDTISSLQHITTYFYRLRAINQEGHSDYSNIVSATTQEDYLLPNQPTNLEAEAISASEIVLIWEDNNDNEGDIEIFESVNDIYHFSMLRTITAVEEADTLNDRQPNTTYYYRIRAVNEYGNSPFSDMVGITTPLSESLGVFAFVAARNYDLFVIDCTDPANPEEIGFCYTQDNARKVEVVNGVAYVASDDLLILDVSDPSNPFEITVFPIETPITDLEICDNRAYISEQGIRDIEENIYNGAGLRIVDFSDPLNPHELGFYDGISIPNAVAVSGDYAFVGNSLLRSDVEELYGGGLRVIDITDPTIPEEVAFYDTLTGIYDIVISSNYVYLTAGGGGLILDVSDPVNPDSVGTFDAGGSGSLTIAGNYLYCAYNRYIYIYDISDPSNPFRVDQYDFGERNYVYGTAVLGGYVYVVGYNIGLIILDKSNPYNLREVGSCYMRGNGYGVAVVNYR